MASSSATINTNGSQIDNNEATGTERSGEIVLSNPPLISDKDTVTENQITEGNCFQYEDPSLCNVSDNYFANTLDNIPEWSREIFDPDYFIANLSLLSGEDTETGNEILQQNGENRSDGSEDTVTENKILQDSSKDHGTSIVNVIASEDDNLRVENGGKLYPILDEALSNTATENTNNVDQSNKPAETEWPILQQNGENRLEGRGVTATGNQILQENYGTSIEKPGTFICSAIINEDGNLRVEKDGKLYNLILLENNQIVSTNDETGRIFYLNQVPIVDDLSGIATENTNVEQSKDNLINTADKIKANVDLGVKCHITKSDSYDKNCTNNFEEGNLDCSSDSTEIFNDFQNTKPSETQISVSPAINDESEGNNSSNETPQSESASDIIKPLDTHSQKHGKKRKKVPLHEQPEPEDPEKKDRWVKARRTKKHHTEKNEMISTLKIEVAENKKGLVECKEELSECKNELTECKNKLTECKEELAEYKEKFNKSEEMRKNAETTLNAIVGKSNQFEVITRSIP